MNTSTVLNNTRSAPFSSLPSLKRRAAPTYKRTPSHRTDRTRSHTNSHHPTAERTGLTTTSHTDLHAPPHTHTPHHRRPTAERTGPTGTTVKTPYRASLQHPYRSHRRLTLLAPPHRAAAHTALHSRLSGVRGGPHVGRIAVSHHRCIGCQPAASSSLPLGRPRLFARGLGLGRHHTAPVITPPCDMAWQLLSRT